MLALPLTAAVLLHATPMQMGWHPARHPHRRTAHAAPARPLLRDLAVGLRFVGHNRLLPTLGALMAVWQMCH